MEIGINLETDKRMSSEDEKSSGRKATGDYNSKQIRALEGVEGIRTRPAMYIGDTTTRGLHHLVFEVVDNCIDEAVNGHASQLFMSKLMQMVLFPLMMMVVEFRLTQWRRWRIVLLWKLC